MFTGLIEHLGRVAVIDELDASESGGGGWSMTIADASPILDDCHIGDSIAVNGCCLTVTHFDSDTFKVGLAPETLSRTNLGELKVGARVNLERAVAAHTRFGGHFVQGHIDDVVTICNREQDGNSLRLTFKVPPATQTRPSLLPYIIQKGFIALDGASLTITFVDDQSQTFGVMLIAHTQSKIELANKPVGATVNVEVDMVGKYVEKSIAAALGSFESSGPSSPLKTLIERTIDNAIQSRLK
ncbi:Riboflavin synthase Short=RS [Serendipita indica DSM 11827]|nr:Riboflavin synthase Short=RS [Serendipita indica DSM 11827]